MATVFRCPCLNVAITGEPVGSSSTGKQDLIGAQLTAEHPFLAHASYSSPGSSTATLKCLNCNTDVASYAAGADPHSLAAADTVVHLDETCMTGSAIDEKRNHESHSHAFRILMEPPNAPEPHLERSPESSLETRRAVSALTPPRTGSRSSSPQPSPIKPRHAQSDPTSSLNARLAHSVRAHRAEIDRQVSVLRRTSEAYTRRAAKEADILAARAGVQRGGFSTTSLTARAAPTPTGETAEPPRSASLSPSRAVNISLNAAAKEKADQASKPKLQQSPYPAPVVRPPPKAPTPRSQSTESLEGKRERKVTFVDPQPAPAPVEPEAISDSPSEPEDDGEEVFELDEDLPEQSQSDESDTDGADAPETPRMASPDARSKGAMSPSEVDSGKAAQALQLRELLAVDLPSHRKSRRRRPSETEEDESIISSNDADSSSDGPSLSQYASSVPVDIDLANPRPSGMAADPGVLAVNGGARSSHRNGHAAPAFATSLREATERALANAASSKSPIKANSSVAAEPMSFSKSPTPDHQFVGSYRGPSSLTSALMRGPPPARAPHTTSTVEEASAEAQADSEEVTDDSTFLPPHELSRRARGAEGLLSTSVRDLVE